MLFHPHLGAASPATEGIATVALCLHVDAADGVSRGIKFPTDATEVAGVVERDRAVVFGLRQFPFGLQVTDELRMVHDFNVSAAVVLVLLAQGVEAVRAGGDDFLHADFLKG